MKTHHRIQKPQNFQLSNTAYLEKLNAIQQDKKVQPLSQLLTIAFQGPKYKKPKYCERIQNFKENIVKQQSHTKTLIQLEKAKREMDGYMQDEDSDLENINEELDPDYEIPLNFANEIRQSTDANELDLEQMTEFWIHRAKYRNIRIDDQQQLMKLVENMWHESHLRNQEQEETEKQEKIFDQCILDFEDENIDILELKSPQRKKIQNYQNQIQLEKERTEEEEFTKDLIHKSEKKQQQKLLNYNNDPKEQFLKQRGNKQKNNIKNINDISVGDYEEYNNEKNKYTHYDPNYYFLEDIENERNMPFPFVDDTKKDVNDMLNYDNHFRNSKTITHSEVYTEDNIVRDQDISEFCEQQQLFQNKKRSQTQNLQQQQPLQQKKQKRLSQHLQLLQSKINTLTVQDPIINNKNNNNNIFLNNNNNNNNN